MSARATGSASNRSSEPSGQTDDASRRVDAPVTDRLQVVIAGGGVAALEAAMALRALAEDRVSVALVSPQERFTYLPLSVGEPFALGEALSVPLEELARELGFEYRHDAIAAVAPEAHTVRLAGGDEVDYGCLVMATGANRVPAFEHATSFRGAEDAEAVHGLIQDVEDGYVRRIAFVVPTGLRWSLPLYELALMTARRAHEMSLDDVEVTLVTSEERPLEIFGPAASRAVTELLTMAGIAVECCADAEVPASGRVAIGERTIECDRVVALALIVGRPVEGLPSDDTGFIPIDEHARVRDVDGVYAAGDGADFFVKQGGIACQQADAAAEAIAGRAGVQIEPKPFHPVLRGKLLTGLHPRYMRTDISRAGGDPAAVGEEPLWWPPAKVASKYLASYLAERAVGAEAHAGPGVVREHLAIVPASGDPEFELLGFERDTR